MYLVLLKIKKKIYFENLNNQTEMMDFIDSIENKFGEIEYNKSIIISGNDDDINEIMEMIEENYYLYIVGRKIDEKVYKELITLIDGISMDVKITFGIEFEEEKENEEIFEEPEPIFTKQTKTIETEDEKVSYDFNPPMELNINTLNDIINDEDEEENIDINTKYSLFIYWTHNSVILSVEELSLAEYDKSKSFKQQFDNIDETLSLFEGFKHDFMELINDETETMFMINDHLTIIQQFIENKILMMEWKDTSSIKYFNGKYRQNKVKVNNEIIENDYLTAKEVMKKLRISDQTLANWRRNNLIDFRKISSRKYLYLNESVNEIFENGVDTSGISNNTVEPEIVSAQIKKINYETEIIKLLHPISFKIPEYKFNKQNFFLNFGNVNIVSSPQVMINNNFQLIDYIKKTVIYETPKELYEYLIKIFKEGKEPRIDTSKKIQSEFSQFYLNKLYKKELS